LSFFDEGDEPTRATARPARPRRPSTGARPRPRRPGGGGGSRGGGSDAQAVRIRQAVALGVGLVLLILIVVGIRSCSNARTDNALKSYNRDASTIIKSSDQDVMAPFFRLMSNGAREAQDLQVQVNQLRQAADDDASRAEGFDVPGDMADAQHDLLMTLNFRRQGLARIAGAIPQAQGRGQASEQGTRTIAANMQLFLASDIVYNQRVAPLIKDALDENGVSGQTVATTKSLPSLEWLSPAVVCDRIGGQGCGGTGGTGTGGVAPGLHGHGIVSVSVGGTTLQPGQVVNRVPAASPTFRVTIANQGDSNERNVPITVTVRGGPKPITVRRNAAATTSKHNATVDIPLGQTPPTGQAVTVEVVAGKVPGEKNTENNRQSYTVLFTQ
jgi:hypothetical protein